MLMTAADVGDYAGLIIAIEVNDEAKTVSDYLKLFAEQAVELKKRGISLSAVDEAGRTLCHHAVINKNINAENALRQIPETKNLFYRTDDFDCLPEHYRKFRSTKHWSRDVSKADVESEKLAVTHQDHYYFQSEAFLQKHGRGEPWRNQQDSLYAFDAEERQVWEAFIGEDDNDMPLRRSHSKFFHQPMPRQPQSEQHRYCFQVVEGVSVAPKPETGSGFMVKINRDAGNQISLQNLINELAEFDVSFERENYYIHVAKAQQLSTVIPMVLVALEQESFHEGIMGPLRQFCDQFKQTAPMIEYPGFYF